jgi:hypothetical protein
MRGETPVFMTNIPVNTKEIPLITRAPFRPFPLRRSTEKWDIAKTPGASCTTGRPRSNVTNVPPTLAPIITTNEPDRESIPTSTKPTAKDVATELLWVTAERIRPKTKAIGFLSVTSAILCLAERPIKLRKPSEVAVTPIRKRASPPAI